MLDYCFNVTMTLITNRVFADQVLTLLARLYGALPEPGYLRMCQCYIYLGDSSATADMLITLIKAGEEAVAFQMVRGCGCGCGCCLSCVCGGGLDRSHVDFSVPVPCRCKFVLAI